jgi:YVTN family beta-propeller protein
MLRWDQDPSKPATVTVGSGPFGVAFDGTYIWVANTSSNSVSKIDPSTNTVTATVTGLSNPLGVAFDGTNIWVANYGSGTVSKTRL